MWELLVASSLSARARETTHRQLPFTLRMLAVLSALFTRGSRCLNRELRMPQDLPNSSGVITGGAEAR
jgi:hypothetical protein